MNPGFFYSILSVLFMALAPTINKFALEKTSLHSLGFYGSLVCSIACLPFLFRSFSWKVIQPKLASLLLAGIMNSLAIFFLFSSLLQTGQIPSFPNNLPGSLALISGSLLGSFLGLLFFYRAIRIIPFYQAHFYRALSPLITFLIAYTFYPVQLSSFNRLGLGILISSLIFYSILKIKRSAKTNIP